MPIRLQTLNTALQHYSSHSVAIITSLVSATWTKPALVVDGCVKFQFSSSSLHSAKPSYRPGRVRSNHYISDCNMDQANWSCWWVLSVMFWWDDCWLHSDREWWWFNSHCYMLRTPYSWRQLHHNSDITEWWSWWCSSFCSIYSWWVTLFIKGN